MEISRQDTLRRELDPLVATARYFGTRENLIITMGQELLRAYPDYRVQCRGLSLGDAREYLD